KNSRNVWVGAGESWTRNSVSIGDGIYKATDGGETWTHAGLEKSERIAKIAVSPKSSDTVFAAVPGALWSDSPDRGLYKTTDGGKTWQQVLKGPNLSTGCTGVAIDPANPDIMFAAMWDFRRKGWEYRSGGESPTAPSASGLFRSTDRSLSARMAGKASRWSAVFKGRTATRTTSGSTQPTRKSCSWETTAECGTPTTVAVNGGKAKTCRYHSFTMSASTTTIRTAYMVVCRTTVPGWAIRSILVASPTRGGKTCTTAMAFGCFPIRLIPITSMLSIKAARSVG